MILNRVSIALLYTIVPASWLHGLLVFHFGMDFFKSVYIFSILIAFTLTPIINGAIGKGVIGKKALLSVGAIFTVYLMSCISAAFSPNYLYSTNTAFEWNVQFFIRSAFLTFLSFAVLQQNSISRVSILKILNFTWVAITVAIAAHYFFGLGGVINNIGNLRDYNSSFFMQGNAIAFVYSISWIVLHFTSVGKVTKVLRSARLAITFVILILMSSASAPPILCLIMLLYYFRPLSSRNTTTRIIKSSFVIIMFITSVLFFNFVLQSLLDVYTLLWQRDLGLLEYRLSNFDTFSVLVSFRDVKFALVAAQVDFAIINFLMGSSFALLMNSAFVESDFIDIFFSLGALGLLVYVLFFTFLFKGIYRARNFNISRSEDAMCKAAVIYTVLQAIATGHILTEPTSSIILGAVLAIIYKTHYRLR